MKGSKPETVDAYIAAASRGARGKLRELRKAIKQAAPEAEERISYRMPYYHYFGRLAYFAAFRNHIGLYIPTPVIAEHKHDLRNYHAVNATVRFPLDKKLPVALVRKLIRARMRKNEARRKK
jgi:uncharacterized protein YdhG (YjbR/CyaY superfamily)